MSTSHTGMTKRGIDLLHDPRLNKSTGFTEAERQTLGLVGLVPDVTESIETQLSQYGEGIPNGLTALLLSRLRFASAVSFHIIFPSFMIGLAARLAVFEFLLRR